VLARRRSPDGRRRGGGRIINVTSVHEQVTRLGAAAYCAAKAGLGMLTKVLALELAEHGITVNVVAPGEIATEMTGMAEQEAFTESRPGNPMGRPGHVNEVASVRLPRVAALVVRAAGDVRRASRGAATTILRLRPSRAWSLLASCLGQWAARGTRTT
jgi:NAD(P)-dependent dehydrogenase (short-subunit alcohol dehydrogenase family)